ncbi:MAG: IS1595 family transposase [Methylovulum sp.]|nr:MAG: IS1595 family transposase [Methylovulum sp.]
MSRFDPLTCTEHQARQYLERLHWPNGAICPRCKKQEVIAVSGGREGLYNCRRCLRQFTVTVGTVFEGSHIPLAKWVRAFHLLCSSKKGMSALQLSRMLGITYKSAWHMAHRIRHAMQPTRAKATLRGTVEVDETYVGGKPRFGDPTPRSERKFPVVALVARESGLSRTKVLQKVTKKTLGNAIKQHVAPGGVLMTDELPAYEQVASQFGRHLTVKHSAREYARGNAHTNTVESFFALLKRGIVGSYHHVSLQHLPRYCDEFSFRWDHRNLEDRDRTTAALKRIRGKRLLYRDS